MLILQLMNDSITVAFCVCLFDTYSVLCYAIMRIGWLAGIIGLNLVSPRIGRVSNSIHPCKLVRECFVVVYNGLTLL